MILPCSLYVKMAMCMLRCSRSRGLGCLTVMSTCEEYRLCTKPSGVRVHHFRVETAPQPKSAAPRSTRDTRFFSLFKAFRFFRPSSVGPNLTYSEFTADA
jgi:hypothetical protein